MQNPAVDFLKVADSAAWYGDAASAAACAFVVGFCYDAFSFAIAFALLLEIATTVASGSMRGWSFAVAILCVVFGAVEPVRGCKLRLRASVNGREFFLMTLVVGIQYVCCRLLSRDSTAGGFASGLLMSEVALAASSTVGALVLELAASTSAEAGRKMRTWACMFVGATSSISIGIFSPIGHDVATSCLACLAAPIATAVVHLSLPDVDDSGSGSDTDTDTADLLRS